MISQIKKLFNLLDKEQRIKLLRLQILVVIMALAEVAGVFAIGPFMALVADMDRLSSSGLISELYDLVGLQGEEFVFWVGFAVLVLLTIAACISMFTTWRLASYSFRLGAELSARLYKYYIQKNWLFHASGNSAILVSKIAAESARLTNLIINPLLQMVAKSVLVVILVIAIFFYSPIVAICGLLIFTSGYFVLYRTVRKRLIANGEIVTQSNLLRMRLMQEGFGGIKDVLLSGRQAKFNDRFESASNALGRAQGNNAVLAQVPRYVVELLAYGSVISLVLFLLSTYQGDLTAVLPVLAVYALAGFKLLPAFQQIYSSVATIRSNMAAFETLLNDFENSKQTLTVVFAKNRQRLAPKVVVELKDIEFKYPNQSKNTLEQVCISVPANKTIGIVGASGSGKSTTVDILLGLIKPNKGVLLVDGVEINNDNERDWQNGLGYVSQSIFLSDSTIKGNIAFGVPEEEVNIDRVEAAIKMANLEELVSGLELGVDTRVGERGMQLSGGQRQRIGIARALYNDPDILVLDEATSSLDGITEKIVMDAIHNIAGKKTIVMIAHRLATVRLCDCIYLMDSGKVVDFGTYSELLKRNSTFEQMAAHF